jgi:hypothetical protein
MSVDTEAPTSASSRVDVTLRYTAPIVASIGLVRAQAPSTVYTAASGVAAIVVSLVYELLPQAAVPSDSAVTAASAMLSFFITCLHFLCCLKEL